MSQVQKDLSSDLQRRLGEVLERQLRIAQHVMSPAELSFTLLEMATSMTLTAAASIAGLADDDKRGATFDAALSAIAEGARSDRARSLAAVQAQRS